eukprot:CAMPEP_0206239762 /NCGR_PEP_ID=MMETSP0047_2-20121206/15566_1 /ASSEMBLY_ACC=CAM_ASM_000192 /TAXON_ID=195065 /ORGANISM="Chroomonas mesostigmatica_cf, Strain CCMP1168" /LENGTH=201 /DNA_ID=CAMNT_0053664475 /DNA_START=72 /DNA_END=674 /DNA_ORIENTATION=-
MNAVLFWTPTFMQSLFGVDRITSGAVCGTTVAVAGCLGNVGSGFLLDAIISQTKQRRLLANLQFGDADRAHMSAKAASVLCLASSLFSFLLPFVHSFEAFCILFFAAQLCEYAAMSTGNMAIISIVTDARVRFQAVPFATLAGQAFGALPSAAVLGVFRDLGGDFLSLVVSGGMMFGCGCCFGMASVIAANVKSDPPFAPE